MGAVRRWARTWWLYVPEPRELSVAFTAFYVLALATGAATLVRPPLTLSAEAGGPQAMASVGALLAAGALLGMAGGACEHWKLERIGLWLMAGGLIIYGSIVLVLHFSGPGSRLTQLGVIAMALIGFLIRFLMIWRFTYRPRG